MRKHLFALSWKFLLAALSATGPAAIDAAVLPQITLVGPAVMTNECHASFTDPGVAVQAGPVAVAAGDDFSFALAANGRVFGWGFSQNILGAPASATNIMAIAAGGRHGLALRGDGTILAWGYGSSDRTNVPGNATNVVMITAAQDHSVAIKADGSLVAWGNGFYGETNVPPHVTNIVSVGAGLDHNVAVNALGKVFAWGRGIFGTTNVPAHATNVVSVTAGLYHNLALRTDGTIVGWGAGTNSGGVFPDTFPNFGQAFIPSGATNVVAIASRSDYNLALKADGTVIAWGANTRGQMNVPVGTSNVVAVAAGGGHSLLLKADGSIIGLGDNQNGEISIPTNLFTSDLTVTVSGTLNTNVPGTYTLTYTATNILGEVGMATRTVIVADTTPPAIVCFTNRIIDFNSGAGAAVSFAAEANDLCSADVSVVCEPASGSIFPVGTTPVRCVATDISGNATQCSFQVTVLGSLSIKAAVLSKLEARAVIVGNLEPALPHAINRLRRSVSTNLWLDETHLKKDEGASVFLNEAAAVQHLKRVLRGHGISTGENLEEYIDRLVLADRTLAELVIAEAIEAGVEPHKIQAASDKLSAGDLAGNQRRSVRAILLYRDAWKIATRAIFRLQAP